MNLVAVAILVCCSSVEGATPDAAAPVLETKIRSVSLFKNGLGYIHREGKPPRGNGDLLIQDLPTPVHGTFWVFAPGDTNGVKDLIAFETDSVEPTDAVTVAEILEANIGATVELRIGEKEMIRGTLVAVPSNRRVDPPLPASVRNPQAYGPPNEMASLVLVRTDDGTIAVDKNSIRRATVLAGETKTTFARKKRVAALRLRSNNPKGNETIVVQYLAKGIAWAPSCVIDISDPKTARLTTKAQIINEIEDLDDVTVAFITGYPNLQFAEVSDPVSLRNDLATFLNSLVNPPQPNQGSRRAVVMQQVMSNAAYIQEDSFPVFAGLPQEGQSREELFFYEQKHVTLKKNERGYYPLLTTEVPYEHLYQWKIADALDQYERYRNTGEQPQSDVPEEVWHSLRLTNTSNLPWTTSPAMTMQGGQVLGQDLLYYASPGSKTTVRVTQAVDIKAEQAEFEVERKRGAAQFYGSNYDLVTVRGQLKVANFKDKDIVLSITKELSGEVIKTSPEAKVDRVAKGLKKVNPKSVLGWEFPIKSREKTELEYQYTVYVRE